MGGGLQIPADFADYLRWKSGGGGLMGNAYRRQFGDHPAAFRPQFDEQDTEQPASFRRHHHRHHHRHFMHPKHRHHHRRHYDDYDDDEDFADDAGDDDDDDFY